MKRKKVPTLTLALTIVVTLFADCTKQPGTAFSATKSQTASGEPITITHWYWAGSSDCSAKMKEIVEDFNKSSKSNVTVKAEKYPWDGSAYSGNLFNAVMGGDGPDTVVWKLTSTPPFTANNLLASLDSYISKWDKKDGINQNVYGIMRRAGGKDEMYVIPWDIQVLYMYYRPSVFRQAGVEVPKTYEEFLEVIKKTILDTSGDSKADVYGSDICGAKGGQEPWDSPVCGHGGDLGDMTTFEFVQGMQDFIDSYKNGYVPPTATRNGFNEIIANFKFDKATVTTHHAGSSVGMAETFGDGVGTFPFPAGKGQWTSMGDTEDVIFEACKSKEVAFGWIFYLTAGEGQEKWRKITGSIPVGKTIQALPGFKNNKFMKAPIVGQSYADIIPIKDTTTEWINTIWPDTVASTLTGEETVADAMKTLQGGLHGRK